ncbi:cytochrome c [Polaromonas sp. CG_9.11]|uniref:c-type cytochrome n=1 Tax=Polaromonas sp. CG_9.11 TaxID=2787730 RepID=UPI0018C95A29|nr:cytochrome c [Polaromonas sp. CG_9.11]MBG6075262.1 mono/diheme cytochrome c family protein [Polaromonas sp. CG_9.11]
MLNDKESQRRAQERETVEPSESSKPIPKLFLIFALAHVLWGAAYIVMAGPYGPSTLGDKRTLADLSGPAPGAAGVVDGKQVFAVNCVACHQATGKGLPGVFPPLDGSEWVIGEARTIVNILLHGVNGEMEVMGATYKGAMPAFKQLSDAELAAVATYVRSGWSNKAGPITPQLFEAERKASTRTAPFAGGAELKALIAKPG